MSDKTKIEWCDSTFNPWIGCTQISPACDHCYAAVSTPARTLNVQWGAGQPRRRASPATWKQPLRWNREDFRECGDCGWRGEIDTLVNDTCPACGKHERLEPARRRVFCASLADVFDNEVPAHWRAALFALIRATPNLDWLLLTKRIGNANAMLNEAASAAADDFCGAPTWDREPWRNVWIGATICNQAEADRDVPKLLRVPAAVRFLSIEPMLGPVILTSVGLIPADEDGPNRIGYMVGPDDGKSGLWPTPATALEKSGLHWIIAGGESGPHARPMHPDWVRSLRDQCAAAGVPFLFKQWGRWAPDPYGRNRERMFVYHDGSTDIPDERLPDSEIEGETAMAPVGKKAAGRLLDGALHNAFPRAAA